MNLKRIADFVNAGIIDPIIMHDKINTVITHGGRFHADEVTLVALIKECHNPDVIVLRGKETYGLLPGNGVLIADVGRIYDGKWSYDHHQNDPKVRNKSSVGLFADDWVNEEYRSLFKIFRYIDACDNGIAKDNVGKEASITTIIPDMNPQWFEDSTDIDQEELSNARFEQAVELVSVIIRSKVMRDFGQISAREELDKIAKTNIDENGVLWLPYFVPWVSWMYESPMSNDAKFITTKIDSGGGYKLYATRNRLFPAEWKHLLPTGVTFMHPCRFFVIIKDKQTLIDIAKTVEMEDSVYENR